MMGGSGKEVLEEIFWVEDFRWEVIIWSKFPSNFLILFSYFYLI